MLTATHRSRGPREDTIICAVTIIISARVFPDGNKKEHASQLCRTEEAVPDKRETHRAVARARNRPTGEGHEASIFGVCGEHWSRTTRTLWQNSAAYRSMGTRPAKGFQNRIILPGRYAENNRAAVGTTEDSYGTLVVGCTVADERTSQRQRITTPGFRILTNVRARGPESLVSQASDGQDLHDGAGSFVR